MLNYKDSYCYTGLNVRLYLYLSSIIKTNKKLDIMKTYQAFTKSTESSQLVNTEIKAKNIKEARKYFNDNFIYNERVYLKK